VIKFIATCLTDEQERACESLGIEIERNYAGSYGEIAEGCVTDFSVHCFNSTALEVLAEMGVRRATLHPELNLAQIRDMRKAIDTEAVIYGRLPLMKLGNVQVNGAITDRMGVEFWVDGDVVYNSVPIFVADKLKEVEKAGVTHGRLIFTVESYDEARAVIRAYMYRKGMTMAFTRGKFFVKGG